MRQLPRATGLGMVLAVMVLTFSVLALAVACAAQPNAVPVGQVGSDPPTPTPTPTLTPTPTADPAMFTTVCADATQATSTATVVINDQLAILEQAAADGDQTRMVAAAVAINNQFTVLSASFTLRAQMLTSPPLSATLTDVSAALAEMASPRYTGTMVDIKKKMIDFALAFAAVCGP